MTSRFIYLHGFASGPTSRKARFFRDRFEADGYHLETPDLTAGDFFKLTIGGQLRVVEDLAQGEPATLIGSSLGGYVAALYASRHPEITRLLLLAPAFQFAQHWRETVGEEAMAKWRSTGSLAIYHYGDQKMRNLSYGFVEESLLWEPEPAFPQPGEIFHGTHDTVVLPESSQRYVKLNPHVGLTLLESDHELTDVLDEIWSLWQGR